MTHSAQKQPTIRLYTGQELPALGLGTWQSKTDSVGNAVKTALLLGYRHIDCAPVYGNEPEIGAALQEVFATGKVKREEVFVTSKLWNTRHDPHVVESACRDTLKALQLDYLDLYLIHWPFSVSFPKAPLTDSVEAAKELGRPPYTPESYLATWKAMEKLVDLGLVKAIGVSNMTVKKLSALLPSCRIKPAVNQVECHPFLSQPELFDFCQKNGIVLVAYSPLGNPGLPPSMRAGGDADVLKEPRVVAIAKEVGCTPAQVVLAWGIHRGHVVIPKSTKESRLKENLDSIHVKLSAQQMAQLNALNRNNRVLRCAVWCWLPGQPWQALWDE